ncbi:MAG: hypothetical protein R2800_05195 [Flavipsychrobacter sp.]
MKESIEKKLKHLCNWCTSILEYLETKYDDPPLFEEQKSIFVYEQAKNTLQNKNGTPSEWLRGYQEAQNDLHTMAKLCLTKEQYEELNAILKEQYNVNIHDISNAKKAKRILKRGTIKNDTEFRLVNDLVDELCQSDGDPTLIEQYNQLLFTYEKSKM